MNSGRVDLRRSGSPVGGTVPLLKKTSEKREGSHPPPPPAGAGVGGGMGKKKKSSHDLFCGCLDGPCANEVCPAMAPWMGN